MFLRNFPKNLIIGTMLLSFVASCSTQLEERASLDFEPTMPNLPKAQKKINMGLFIATASRDCLQQIDVRPK